MSIYQSGTILTLKEPHGPDPETKEPFAYNEVEVIGPSPISKHVKGDYLGDDARGVIIVARSNFGSTLDEPFGKLREIYEVKSIPEDSRSQLLHQAEAQAMVKQAKVLDTPEDIFAAEAPGVAPEEGQTRGRTLGSPLEDPPSKLASPLDPPPAKRTRAKA